MPATALRAGKLPIHVLHRSSCLHKDGSLLVTDLFHCYFSTENTSITRYLSQKTADIGFLAMISLLVYFSQCMATREVVRVKLAVLLELPASDDLI